MHLVNIHRYVYALHIINKYLSTFCKSVAFSTESSKNIWIFACFGVFLRCFSLVGGGGDFVPMVDSFSWLRLNVPFWGLGWACLCRGWAGGCARRKDSPTDRRTQKSPPCVKGGRGGSRRGDRRGWGVGLFRAIGGGQGTRETDVGGSEATDSRACYVDPACLGRGRDCPPLAQGRLFLGGKIPRRPGVGPVGAVGGWVRILLRRGLPLLG